MEQLIWIKNTNYDIHSILCMPDHAESGETSTPTFPAVILCHGTGSHKDEVGNMFARLAAALAQQGIASLRFDFAGCGDSTAPQQALSFFGEVSYVRTAYAYLRERADVDICRIAILGFSQGARVMAEFLKEAPELATAVSWSGACHNGPGVFDGWFSLYYEEALANGFSRIPMDWRDDLLVSREWFDEIRDSHPMEGFAQYEQPVLAIAGTADSIVPFQHADEIIGLCSHPDSKTFILPGADHTFNVLTTDQTQADTVLQETVTWFCAHLN